jgi:hypothetical protein
MPGAPATTTTQTFDTAHTFSLFFIFTSSANNVNDKAFSLLKYINTHDKKNVNDR